MTPYRDPLRSTSRRHPTLRVSSLTHEVHHEQGADEKNQRRDGRCDRLRDKPVCSNACSAKDARHARTLGDQGHIMFRETSHPRHLRSFHLCRTPNDRTLYLQPPRPSLSTQTDGPAPRALPIPPLPDRNPSCHGIRRRRDAASSVAGELFGRPTRRDHRPRRRLRGRCAGARAPLRPPGHARAMTSTHRRYGVSPAAPCCSTPAKRVACGRAPSCSRSCARRSTPTAWCFSRTPPPAPHEAAWTRRWSPRGRAAGGGSRCPRRGFCLAG